MQVVITPAALVIGCIAFAAAVIIFMVYYQFFYKKTKRAKERLNRTYFVPEKFIEDTKPTTFKYHDEKWGRILLLLVMSCVACSFLPAVFGVPDPYNAYLSLIGVIATLGGLIVFSMQLTMAERERNVNTTYGSAHVIYPEIGHVGQALKRMKVKKEIKLKENEQEKIVDELMKYVEQMKEFKELSEDDQKGIKTIWMDKIKDIQMRRFSVVDSYDIFIVGHNDFEDMRTAETTEMIDETVPVNVQLAPMFLFYAGPANRIFKNLDDDGRVGFKDMRAGVFVDLFDLFNVKEILTTGSFTMMTKTDALLGEALHLFEERSATSTEMTKVMQELDKAKTENEENEFNAQAEANKIVSAAKLLSILSSFLQGKTAINMPEGAWKLIIFFIGISVGMVIKAITG